MADLPGPKIRIGEIADAPIELEPDDRVVLTTDSVYVKSGITEWLANWKTKGWKTAGRKPVKNADLWRELDEQNKRHDVSWHWVKGHSGHRENEIADQLANRGIDETNGPCGRERFTAGVSTASRRSGRRRRPGRRA